VTNLPYRQVAKYQDNKVPLTIFPTFILQVAQMYNDAYVLVEINDTGQQVAEALHFDFGYENLYKIQAKGRMGQQISHGFKKAGMNFGIKTSTATKRIGCSNIKTLIEKDKLIINDKETIQELTTFAADKQSFAGEPGSKDDLAMTLVQFGWLAAQRIFRESTDTDLRKNLQEEQLNIMDTDLVPFGIISNGLEEDMETNAIDGDIWIRDRRKKDPFGDFGYDWTGKERL
jgi:hypothetical protein